MTIFLHSAFFLTRTFSTRIVHNKFHTSEKIRLETIDADRTTKTAVELTDLNAIFHTFKWSLNRRVMKEKNVSCRRRAFTIIIPDADRRSTIER